MPCALADPDAVAAPAAAMTETKTSALILISFLLRSCAPPPRDPMSIRSPDLREQRKRVEQPIRESRELPGHHRGSHHDHDAAGRRMACAADAPGRFQPLEQAIGECGRNEERQTEAERIGREEEPAALNGRGACSDREDGAENRTDAGASSSRSE